MKWLMLRRLCQLGVLGVFLLGPLAGIWILRGDLAGSRLFGFLPLGDPLTLFQTMAAGHAPAPTALVGAAIIFLFYLLVGGRTFCSWVCPVNIINDAAAWIRQKLPLKSEGTFGPGLRYWLLALVLLVTVLSGTAFWEDVNPVNVVARSTIFFLRDALWMGTALFLAGLLIRGGWCRICPTGALYSLSGWFSPIKIRLEEKEKCDHCKACYRVCPEPQVLIKPLQEKDAAPFIRSGNCTNCGRCIDVCPHSIFRFGRRI